MRGEKIENVLLSNWPKYVLKLNKTSSLRGGPITIKLRDVIFLSAAPLLRFLVPEMLVTIKGNKICVPLFVKAEAVE